MILHAFNQSGWRGLIMRSNQISFLQAHLATTEWQYKAEQTRCRTNLSRQQEGNNEQVPPKIDDLEKQWAPNEGHWSFFTCKYKHQEKGTSGINWKHVCPWIVVANAAPSRKTQNSQRLEMPTILACAIVPNEKSSPFRPLRNNLNCTPCWLKIYDVISILWLGILLSCHILKPHQGTVNRQGTGFLFASNTMLSPEVIIDSSWISLSERIRIGRWGLCYTQLDFTESY